MGKIKAFFAFFGNVIASFFQSQAGFLVRQALSNAIAAVGKEVLAMLIEQASQMVDGRANLTDVDWAIIAKRLKDVARTQGIVLSEQFVDYIIGQAVGSVK